VSGTRREPGLRPCSASGRMSKVALLRFATSTIDMIVRKRASRVPRIHAVPTFGWSCSCRSRGRGVLGVGASAAGRAMSGCEKRLEARGAAASALVRRTGELMLARCTSSKYRQFNGTKAGALTAAVGKL
jgi:hypothetical protein